MPQKETERFQLEQFILSDPDFSGVEIKDHDERPDFIVEKHRSPFGIEVTQLYRPASSESFALREVEAFREKIIARAREIYKQRNAPAVHVGVMFSDMSYAPTELEPLADELATFVQGAYPFDRPGVIFTDDNTSIMPTAFAGIRISKYASRETGFWSMEQCGTRAVLDRTIIQEAIDAKNRLVPVYRLRIPTVWLLLVMDALYLSSSFTVPEEIVCEPYSCAFDRAFLFSLVDGRSWPLMLRPA